MGARTPEYRHFKPKNLGYVRCKAAFGHGNRHYFPGDYNSPTSLAAYYAFKAEHFPPSPHERRPPPTVGMLLTLYLDWMLERQGRTTRYDHVRNLMRAVKFANSSSKLAVEFGPKSLLVVRATMERGWTLPAKGKRAAKAVRWSRSFINDQIRRLCQVFRWGVMQEIVTAQHWQNLKAVPDLRANETKAPEKPPVCDVAWSSVAATLPHMTPVLAAMVELQQLTGMRSANLCNMTEGQIDRSRPTWIYAPDKHKTQHIGKRLLILLGPKCQKILAPFLGRGADTPLFSPAESEAHRLAVLRDARKSKVQPSQESRAKANPKKKPGNRYDTASYRRAIKAAIKRSGTPHFHPHQIRHTRSNEIKALYGVESSTAYIGHSSIDANEVYNERDLERAMKVANEIC